MAMAFDLSSASVLARQVLSDTITFLYLADRNISEEDRNFRRFVWSLQALKQSYDYFTLHDPSNPILTEVEIELSERFEYFEQHELYKQTSNGIRGLIKAGRRALWKTDYEILNGYDLRKKCYDAPFLIFPNFVHASELSVHLILETGAQKEDNERRFFFSLVNTIAFFAFDIEVLIQTFPAARSHITDQGIALVKACTQPIRKEN